VAEIIPVFLSARASSMYVDSSKKLLFIGKSRSRYIDSSRELLSIGKT